MDSDYQDRPLWIDRTKPTERVGSILLFHFSNRQPSN
jgi:hypothetical protein